MTWKSILKKDPVAASKGTKITLRLADEIEALGAEVDVVAPNEVWGATLVLKLPSKKILDSPFEKVWEPVAKIKFNHRDGWIERQRERLQVLKNRHIVWVERLNKEIHKVIEKHKNLRITEAAAKERIEGLRERIEDGDESFQKEIKNIKENMTKNNYYSFKYHSRAKQAGYVYMKPLVERFTRRWVVEDEEFNEEGILKLVKELIDFVKEIDYEW
tara:strand:+ start:714 stop:1361 length:648 start_codon:yes stop_codon:yes gene_type:complete